MHTCFGFFASVGGQFKVVVTSSLDQVKVIVLLFAFLLCKFCCVVCCLYDLCKVLYENIDQILLNKLHEPMCYKIGNMCIQWTHALYSVVITCHSNPPISQFNSPCNEFTTVWSMFVYNTFIVECLLCLQC